MAAAQEFYNYADEHFGWAETAKTERERAIFLQMAAAWLEVAQRWEAAKGVGERVGTAPKSSLASRRRCSSSGPRRLDSRDLLLPPRKRAITLRENSLLRQRGGSPPQPVAIPFQESQPSLVGAVETD